MTATRLDLINEAIIVQNNGKIIQKTGNYRYCACNFKYERTVTDSSYFCQHIQFQLILKAVNCMTAPPVITKLGSGAANAMAIVIKTEI